MTIKVLHVYREIVCVLVSALNSGDKKPDKIQVKKCPFSFSSLDNSVLLLLGHKFCFKNLLSINIMKKVKAVVLHLLNIFH